MTIYEKLMSVQANLKAPKSNYNSFGKYNYRSCEDILEGLKPHLSEVKAIVNLTDTIELIGDRYYIKATAIFIDAETGDKVEVSALAREDETKKGMDLAQVTGSVSSYARKYALNGMFCIDDTKDSDATNTHGKDDSSKNDYKGDTGTQHQGNTNTQPISEAQAKRLFALSKGNTQAAKEVMLKHGYTESKQIKKSDYEVICEEIQKAVS
jgi:hypothetical protein